MEKDKGGRPPVFETPEELNDKIEAYFSSCSTLNQQATITGLCYDLGFESRQSFYDYEKRDGFSYTIKRARLKMESLYEAQLFTKISTGAIFGLKNFGWTDRSEVDLTSDGKEIKGFILGVKPQTE